ncbi:MAG TPA: hypothetical protein VF658_19950 [Pyrinomonadaceae bacterium]|jgi:lysophospholipase L1-like esterase
MKANRPHFALLCAIIFVVLFSFACNKASRREVVKIGIARTTHIPVGQPVKLSAYEEYSRPASAPDAVHAASDENTDRALITPKWSINDSASASISEAGELTATKPGRVTVKGTWNNYEATTTIEAVYNLRTGPLPQLSAQGTKCKPQAIELNMSADRTLRFNLSFDDNRCRDVAVTSQAPEQPLPWKFPFDGGMLELTNARGLVVTGEAIVDAGKVSFTVWSEGAGAYPVSLAGKTVLLVGDSMAEGIGWSLKGKVLAAGGRYVGEPWCSSTTCTWQESGRLSEVLARHKPDIVFIALGSNEIFIKDAEKSRAPAIRRMVEELGERPAYWIGPPSWKPDKGIVNVIEANFQPGHFYNSNDLKVPRRKDGAHPTVEGYQTWTELIWDWYARIG